MCTAGACGGASDSDNDGLGDASDLSCSPDPCPADPLNACAGPVALDGFSGKEIRVNAGPTCSVDVLDCRSKTWNAEFGARSNLSTAICDLPGGCPVNASGVFGCTDASTESLFQCEHYDPDPADPDLVYDFDVANGKYLVNLLFMNSYTGTANAGTRLFDVVVEGQLVLDEFDQVVAAGGSGVPVVRSIAANVSDGNGLQIELLHGALENPAVKGIEVLSQCVVTGEPEDSCNGIDDDCDDAIDEDYVASATNCGVGVCSGNTGLLTCQAGALVDTCDPVAGAAPDDATCDNLDNNCNGSTDEDYVATATGCGVGVCSGNTGLLTCQAGALVDTCDPLAGAAPDDATCDNLDNNCNGSTDEGYVPTATGCGVGVCSGNTGLLTCQAGALVDTCDPLAGAAPDDATCDNLDNNCNGSTDEGYVATATSCGVGVCSGNTGLLTCQAGVEVDSCDPLAGASAEVCDNLDNNCDGTLDDGVCTGEAFVAITPGGDILASSFEGNAFQITNQSLTGAQIVSISFDLRTSLLPDMVFDPNGDAGDALGKCFTPDTGAAATGLLTPGSAPDSCSVPYSSPHNGDVGQGFDVLTLEFGDFDPGETFGFSADVDPTSIKDGTGTNQAGNVSGLELSGATVTLAFSDGTVLVGKPFRQPGSNGGSQDEFREAPSHSPRSSFWASRSRRRMSSTRARRFASPDP